MSKGKAAAPRTGLAPAPAGGPRLGQALEHLRHTLERLEQRLQPA